MIFSVVKQNPELSTNTILCAYSPRYGCDRDWCNSAGKGGERRGWEREGEGEGRGRVKDKYSLYWHVTNLQCILPKLQFHTVKKSI